MSEGPKTWRYFRLNGEPPTRFGLVYNGDSPWGRFYRLGSGSRQYKGGEVVYVDRLDPDKMSWPDLNIYAEDLGYGEPPIMYWFLLPGSIQGEGWLPICEDKDVLDMLKFMPSNRILQIYIVGGGVRKKREAELEDEGGGSPKEVDHQKYIGNMVEDLEEVIDGGPAVTSNYCAEISNGAEVPREANGKRNKGGRPKNKKDVESETREVPATSNIASALSQPVISSSSLTQVNIQPQSCSQQTVIRSSHNSKTFVCPNTRMLMKSKSVAQKPKPVTRSNTSGRAQQGPTEGSNKRIWKP